MIVKKIKINQLWNEGQHVINDFLLCWKDHLLEWIVLTLISQPSKIFISHIVWEKVIRSSYRRSKLVFLGDQNYSRSVHKVKTLNFPKIKQFQNCSWDVFLYFQSHDCTCSCTMVHEHKSIYMLEIHSNLLTHLRLWTCSEDQNVWSHE